MCQFTLRLLRVVLAESYYGTYVGSENFMTPWRQIKKLPSANQPQAG